MLHQGSPGPHAVEILNEFCELVRTGHPRWPDFVDLARGDAYDLVGESRREDREQSERARLLQAFLSQRPIFAAKLQSPCGIVDGLCLRHNAVVELLRILGPDDSSFESDARALIGRDPAAHQPMLEFL